MQAFPVPYEIDYEHFESGNGFVGHGRSVTCFRLVLVTCVRTPSQHLRRPTVQRPTKAQSQIRISDCLQFCTLETRVFPYSSLTQNPKYSHPGRLVPLILRVSSIVSVAQRPNRNGWLSKTGASRVTRRFSRVLRPCLMFNLPTHRVFDIVQGAVPKETSGVGLSFFPVLIFQKRPSPLSRSHSSKAN